MIVINQSACSEQFNAAWRAIQDGRSIRRKSWPTGQELFMRTDGCIVVRREGSSMLHVWQGPSGAETDATDWELGKMSQYEQLDAIIVKAIGDKLDPLYCTPVSREANRLEKINGREAFRIIDGRLQALRKKGLIQHLTKSEANALGVVSGWSIPQNSKP